MIQWLCNSMYYDNFFFFFNYKFSIRLDWRFTSYICVFLFFFFFFFFDANVSAFKRQYAPFNGSHALFTRPTNTLFRKKH